MSYDIGDFLSDVLDTGYGRHRGAGCTAIIGLAVATVAILLWVDRHGSAIRIGSIATVITLVVFFGLYRIAIRVRPNRLRLDPSAQPTPLAAIKAGEMTHTAGLLGVGSALVHAPLGAPACAWYRVVVAPVAQPESPIFELRSADAFVLDDGQGAKLSVTLDGAELRIERSHDLTTSADAPDAALDAYLAERGIAVAGPVRARVEWITPHELVFVRGVARDAAHSSVPSDALVYRGTDGVSPLEIVGTDTEPVHIALVPIGTAKRV